MQYAKKSLPSRERGLKSICSGRKHTRPSVAPLAGAWIEIIRTAIFHPFSESLPSRERGLKSSLLCVGSGHRISSLPSRERGLKYHVNLKHCPVSLVAPLAGAWIEIERRSVGVPEIGSLPSRERGLKCRRMYQPGQAGSVAPLAGAWIEIFAFELEQQEREPSLPSRERGLKSLFFTLAQPGRGRSPRGSVD